MRVLSLRYRVHFHVKRRFSFVLYLLFCLKCTLSKDLPRKDSFIIYVKDLFKMYTCSKKHLIQKSWTLYPPTFCPRSSGTLRSHFTIAGPSLGSASTPWLTLASAGRAVPAPARLLPPPLLGQVTLQYTFILRKNLF